MLAFGDWQVAVSAAAVNSEPAPLQLTLTWTEDPRTTQTIQWKKKGEEGPGWVEWREIGTARWPSPKGQQLLAEEKHVNAGEDNITVYQVTVRNLKPGTRYSYRVGEGERWYGDGAFQTPPVKAASFQFLIFGDSQSINYQTWGETLRRAWRQNPAAAFLVNVGDLVDVGQDERQWNGWFRAAEDVIRQIPVMPATGNHEYYTREGRFSFPSLFAGHFALPRNGPEGLAGRVYSYDYGNVHFVVLDSQAWEQAAWYPTLLAAERKWLEADLKATQQPWKVVFVHRPLYGNSSEDHGAALRRAFEEVLTDGKADILFSGHEHVYARSAPMGRKPDAAGNWPGLKHVATGRSGSKTYHDMVRREWDEFFYNPLESPVYLAAEVDGMKFTVRVYDQNGHCIDTWDIQK